MKELDGILNLLSSNNREDVMLGAISLVVEGIKSFSDLEEKLERKFNEATESLVINIENRSLSHGLFEFKVKYSGEWIGDGFLVPDRLVFRKVSCTLFGSDEKTENIHIFEN